MPKIRFINENQTIEVPAGSNLRQEALKAGVQLYPGLHKYLNCRGFGQCASCRVLIKKGIENTNSMGSWEKFRLWVSPLNIYVGHEAEMRLACKTTVNGDVEVETKPPLHITGEKFWA